MLKTLWNSRSGLNSNQNRIDAISNNIANVETTGYKRIDVAFQDIFSENMNRLGLPVTTQNIDSLLLGSGSKADKLVKNNQQGNLKETGRQTDIAIDGSGYFKLLDQEGNPFYTRDGSFDIDSDGNFVHSSGMNLVIEGFNISALSSSISINANGEITSEKGIVGRIAIFDFQDKEGMTPVGNNLFKGSAMQQESEGIIKQGYLEESNVDIAKELTDMMITQRAFELNSRTVKAADDMWQIANNLRSK
jgi:flagellar basal-body rod protein FlgG